MMGSYIPMDVEPDYYPQELYYDEEANRMVDFTGRIVHDVYRYITPSQLYLFKKRDEDMVVIGRHGSTIGLLRLRDDEDGYFEHYYSLKDPINDRYVYTPILERCGKNVYGN